MNKSAFDLKNKHSNYSFFIFFVSCASVFFCSCGSASLTLEAKNQSPNNTNANHSNLQNFKQTQSIDFKGVSFQNKIPSVSEIVASEEPAVPLEDENDKADYVQPRHILFKMKGEYAEQHKKSYSSPEITVYPIAEYRQAGEISIKYMKWFDETINKLQKTISKKTATTKKEISDVTFHEGSPEIIAHFKQIPFKNGKGILYITQYNVDWATIINNQQLSYIFQGISEDGKYYVQAIFPITVKGLPNSLYDNKFGDYELTQTYFDEKDRAKYAAYKKYLASVETLLNNSKTNEFSPDLTKIEETLSSLEVNWKD